MSPSGVRALLPTRGRVLWQRISARQAAAPTQQRFQATKSGESMSSGVMYNWRVEAVKNALAKKGKAEGPLTIEDLISLGHLDQYHYLGVEACDELIHTLGLDASSTVLDVGAGIGGPARYISAKSGCSITGIDLQADLVEAGRDLTQRVGLANRVKLLVGDFGEVVRSQSSSMKEQFDHVMSLLSFCHFPDRDGALKLCHECTKPGGTFLIEDLAMVGSSFTESERKDLLNVVGCPSVTSPAQYVAALESAGFVDIQVVDMSKPWQKWTKARHETFVANKEETVRLHGEDLFKSRAAFYEVVDNLFAGGNLGGVRITGRKPGLQEEKLRHGRSALPAGHGASSNVTLNEFGSRAAEVAASGGSASSTEGAVQPHFPAGPLVNETQYHDSLQYHFFFPGIFIAGRIFHSKTLQQHSAWMYNVSTGETKELFSPSYDVMVQKAGVKTLHLDSNEFHISDSPEGGSFVAKGLGIKVDFRQDSVFSWVVNADNSDGVIHRPDIRCKVELDGKTLEGIGYSKRYYGIYPRFWGYRFIQGTVGESEGQPAVFWTADAAFGDLKYNYFKVLPRGGKLLEAEFKDTWQQDTSAYGFIGGVRHEVHIRPLTTWETVIGGPGKSMESKMQNRYCEVELVAGGRRLKGVAYNERCYGTVG